MLGGLSRSHTHWLHQVTWSYWGEARLLWDRPLLLGHTVLTSGQNGGSNMCTSSLLKLTFLNTGCFRTPAAPSPMQPRRCWGFLVSNWKKQKWRQKLLGAKETQHSSTAVTTEWGERTTASEALRAQCPPAS